MVWLPMFGIFNVRADADACDCTRGLYGHRERVCTESWLWEKKPLPHLGLEPTSVLRLTFQSDALPTELFPTLCFVLAAVVVFFSPSPLVWFLVFVCQTTLLPRERECLSVDTERSISLQWSASYDCQYCCRLLMLWNTLLYFTKPPKLNLLRCTSSRARVHTHTHAFTFSSSFRNCWSFWDYTVN